MAAATISGFLAHASIFVSISLALASVGTAIVDDAAPARLFHEWNDSPRTVPRSDILQVEILQQILFDGCFDRTGRGSSRVSSRSPLVRAMIATSTPSRANSCAMALPISDCHQSRSLLAGVTATLLRPFPAHRSI
jgi:hypothetical protein